MAKYSTGSGGGGGDGDACELCGKESSRLTQANVAGATLLVCRECAPHDDSQKGRSRGRSGGQDGGGGGGSSGSGSSGGGPTNRKKRAAQRQAKIYDAGKGDSTHWEKEGTNYERDRLPYLVSGYGERVEAARREADLTPSDVAAELDIDEKSYLAVEGGRATRAGVGGSIIRKLESYLDVQLVDE